MEALYGWIVSGFLIPFSFSRLVWLAIFEASTCMISWGVCFVVVVRGVLCSGCARCGCSGCGSPSRSLPFLSVIMDLAVRW